MKETYSIEKQKKRLERSRLLSIVLMGIGVVRIVVELMEDANGDWTEWLENMFYPALGLGIFLHATKRLKTIVGSHITFDTEGFSFQSRHIKGEFESYSQVSSVEVKLKIIKIKDQEGKEFVIHMDDYVVYSDRVAIKAKFDEISKKASE